MKITITNDDGEVYAVLTNVQQLGAAHATGVDEEGQPVTLSEVLDEAAQWEQRGAPRTTSGVPVPAIPCRLGTQRVNDASGYCEAHGARWIDGDDVCWGVIHYGAARA